MGRAIDMEKDIDVLKLKIEKLENVVRGMTHTLEEIEDEIYEVEDKSPKTKHIDLIEETKTGDADGEKETNNEGNGKSGKQSNNKRRKSKKKNV